MNLKQLLDLPVDQLEKIPTDELKTMLAPYIGPSRKPLLPPDKPTKATPQERMMREVLAQNKDLIAKLKAQRS